MVVGFPEALVAVLFGLIDQLLNPDNSGMMTDLLGGLISALISIPTMLIQLAESLLSSGMLGVGSALNALNLFNIVPQALLGFIPFSHIGQGNPNLLANPSFDGAVSVQGGKMWLWDPNVGHTSPGSVYCTANGQLKQLRSNVIPVSVDQELAISVYSMWSGLTYTGTTPIKLQVVRFLEGAEIGTEDLVAPLSPAANQSAWLQLTPSASYVVPAGCDNICLQLSVAATATAGTVRFDDGE
jgi:hypothetical protein